MKYVIKNNKIFINGLDDFDIAQILECGQVFRYKKLGDNHYEVFFGQNKAVVRQFDTTAEIECNDILAAARFFDLDKDYSQIKKELMVHEVLREPISHGHGIRILKNNPEEIIFSFIISANNNIKRIQGIIEKLCELGEDKGGYRAFPSAEKIANASDEFLASLHAGYRAPYLKETAKALLSVDLNEKANLSSPELKKWLLSLKGVGPKVASCIMLFGFYRFDNFPVDTWIEKVYRQYFYVGEKSRPEIEKHFLQVFGGTLSGIVQQYLFYYMR